MMEFHSTSTYGEQIVLGNLRRINNVNTYSFMSWGVEVSFSATFLIQVAATGPMAESSEEATLSCCGLWMTNDHTTDDLRTYS